MKANELRKDQQGRNTVLLLRYFEGFMKLDSINYKNLNIHQKITIRASFCGVCYPSMMIAEKIQFQNKLSN